ncbi:hypothetical protein [Rubinisphaera brasiliensis]|uniref:Uncharacterized protein n=1 Tax=Rubinisphaera brasiliensis (strain ATCC 49424 / DSM 5305 / JCM 21570 / IAM 15109 / NBRC 103401 / IFAM 1448) TaxID=756272 RepID=F0SPH3_RUBBR|nr:hypothetical protein [Rubinisphaera brasiliensis]ADY57877.1 hypothetical protein Plabr_0248 [Rubinisphaera brasiliensis DSM 5305]
MSRYVKVTATLGTPLALSPEGAGPSLDALIEYRSAQLSGPISETGRHKQATARGVPVPPGSVWTPLESTDVGGIPIPHCSAAIFCGTEDVERIAKQFPLDKVGQIARKDHSKINTTGGEFKSWFLPLRTTCVDQVVWYASLRGGPQSKPSRLKRLLKPVTEIGKKANHGFGRVLEWTVEPIDCDYSWFADSPAGRVLMRPLPLEAIPDDCVGWRSSFGAAAPPYWNKDFYQEIGVPC